MEKSSDSARGSLKAWSLSLTSAGVLIMLQLILIGSPDPARLSGDRGFEPSPLNVTVPAMIFSNGGMAGGNLDSATTYRSRVSLSAPSPIDSIAGIVTAYDDQYSPRAGLFLTHTTTTTTAPRETRWIELPNLDPDYAFTATSMAVGDFNGTSDDIVVGYFNASGRLLVLLDPDPSVFSAPIGSPAIAQNQQFFPAHRTVPFNCNGASPQVCAQDRRATVHAITTGDYNGDALRDIALVANTSLAGTDETDEREYLFICLQTPGVNFSCRSMGEMVDDSGQTPPGGSGCSGLAGDEKCNGTARNPYPESFQIESVTTSTGRQFLGLRSTGTHVQVFTFQSIVGGQILSFADYDYEKPVASASFFDFNQDGYNLDLVVQLQPDVPPAYSAWSLFDFPYLEVSVGSPGVIPGRIYPADRTNNDLAVSLPNRLIVPISNQILTATSAAPSDFLVATPLTAANFAPSGGIESRGLAGMEYGVSGKLFADQDGWYDTYSAPADTKYLVGGVTRNVLSSGTNIQSEQITDPSAPPPPPPPSPVFAFSGEFARALSVTADDGRTAMRPDFAALTDPLADGSRLLLIQPNRNTQTTLVTKTLTSSLSTVTKLVSRAGDCADSRC